MECLMPCCCDIANRYAIATCDDDFRVWKEEIGSVTETSNCL